MHHVLAALQGLKVLELFGFPVQEWGGGGGGREGCGSDGFSVLVFQFQGRILVRGAHRNSPPSQNFEFWSSQKLAPICQAPLRAA